MCHWQRIQICGNTLVLILAHIRTRAHGSQDGSDVDEQSLTGTEKVSGYVRNHENHCQKCHQNQSA